MAYTEECLTLREIRETISDYLISDVAGICMDYLESDIKKLKVGDLIDAKDIRNKIYPALIVKKDDIHVRISYIGWSRRWDINIGMNNEILTTNYGIIRCMYAYNIHEYEDDLEITRIRQNISYLFHIDIKELEKYTSYKEIVESGVLNFHADHFVCDDINEIFQY